MTIANSSVQEYHTLIFDIRNVLTTSSLVTSTSISPGTIYAILTPPIWQRYECGLLTETECYQIIAVVHDLNVAEVTRAFQDVRDSITLNTPLFAFIRELKCEFGDTLRLFAMSNISNLDIEFLVTKYTEWDIFDGIFTSAAAGARKPSAGFFPEYAGISG